MLASIARSATTVAKAMVVAIALAKAESRRATSGRILRSPRRARICPETNGGWAGPSDARQVRYAVERLRTAPRRPNRYAPAGSAVYGDSLRLARAGAADARVASRRVLVTCAGRDHGTAW